MTIGEIASATNISEYTLRYYEKKGLIRVKRDAIGRRCYEKNDIEWVKFIQRLKDTGMLLRDIKKYAQLRYAGNETMTERLSMLQEHREYVLEQQKKWADYLDNLDKKIVFYQNSITKDKIKPTS
ncbi:MAG: MerR family transcriptional regulator [Lachnospiraceae bacterium]|nr:MerR family transcriptional regulator [Lachnospiraceae bacterium]